MNQTHTNRLMRWLAAGLLFGLAACAPAATPTTSSTAQPVTRAAQPTGAAAATSAPTAAPTTASQGTAAPRDCVDGVTPSQTEGPYYRANTPERASLLQPGMAGTMIVVTGYVFTRDCKPIAGA